MNGEMKMTDSGESRSLRFLYNTAFGRILLKPLTSRTLSKMCGAFLNSRLSKPLIKPFVEHNGIDLGEYYSDDFKCFNDCFTRKIKPELRKIDMTPNVLIAPCDALLSAYKIENGTVLAIKQSRYTVSDLLCNDELAEKFNNGICLVFRLCVNHYHRYCYVDNGTKGENVFIKGRLHTVRPIACEAYPVFKQNCREYTVMKTDNFGTVAQIEVGAMLVGRILNHDGAGRIRRGDEKGMFLYGGSTVVLLLQKDAVTVPDELFAAANNGEEIPVKMGEPIAHSELL